MHSSNTATHMQHSPHVHTCIIVTHLLNNLDHACVIVCLYIYKCVQYCYSILLVCALLYCLLSFHVYVYMYICVWIKGEGRSCKS